MLRPATNKPAKPKRKGNITLSKQRVQCIIILVFGLIYFILAEVFNATSLLADFNFLKPFGIYQRLSPINPVLATLTIVPFILVCSLGLLAVNNVHKSYMKFSMWGMFIYFWILILGGVALHIFKYWMLGQTDEYHSLAVLCIVMTINGFGAATTAIGFFMLFKLHSKFLRYNIYENEEAKKSM